MSYPTETSREPFGQNYFTQRNYKDYLSRKFDALASDIVVTTHVYLTDPILDFGCGYGALLNAIHHLGFENVTGTDISQWAIEEGKRRFPHIASRLEYYNRNLLTLPNQLLVMLDVLEHMPEYEVENVLKLAAQGAKGQIVVRIPVCAVEGEPFILPVSNNDPTHITCHTKNWWFDQFTKAGLRCLGAVECHSIYDSPGVLAAIFQPCNAAGVGVKLC